jgi:WD40 repeat protein
LYDNFDFKIQKTRHFNIHHYLDSSTINSIALLSERWYDRYESLLKDTFLFPLPVIIYADHPDFQQTEVISGLIDVGTGGVTEGLKTRLVMPLAGTYAGTEHVLGHEMTHMFQYHLLSKSDSTRLESIFDVPLWMIEGMAEYLSLGPENTFTAMWMRDATFHNDIPSIKKITYNYRYNPYRYGHALWSFIAGTWGDSTVRTLFLNTAILGPEKGVKNTIGITYDSLSYMWEKSISENYQKQIADRSKPYATGKCILSEFKQGGEYFFSPSISPDGNKVIFYSEKDLFTIDVFLADANDGKIIRQLGKKAGKTHYDEINFIASSGAWSPDGERFAFSVYSEGDQKIILTEIKTGRTIKTIELPDLGSIINIAWSPNGKQLLISGTGSGSSMADLFLYDLENGSIKKITNDLHADIHPAWSPEGTAFAFASDRGIETDFTKLRFSKMQICIYNLSDNKIKTLALFSNCNHINPQYSPDGKSILFISDPDGINNIYRYDIENKSLFKVTNVISGVCGLTNLSPAITISKETGDLIFTLYDDMQYKGYRLSSKETTGEYIDPQSIKQKLNLLPPEKRKSEFVSNYIKTPTATPLSKRILLSEKRYKPQLQLDYVGGLYAGAGINQYGAALEGGVFFSFSDMLNRHVLNTAVQVSGKITNIALMSSYMNQSKRFHWGGYVSHIPYLSSYISSRRDTIKNGSQLIVNVVDQVILHSYEDKVAVIGSYPVSMTKRWDFQLGETVVNYTKEVTTFYPAGAPVENSEVTKKVPAPAPTSYTSISAAYVGDNAFFGITDPMKGFRYRFEAEGIINSYKIINLLADYRAYRYIKPVSFAVRLMHYGRYFKDAENSKITPLFLGSEYFIRGYSIYSFESSECNGNETGNCPVFSRLIGSKIGIMNLEMRLPFTGPRRLAIIKSNVFFSSLNLFIDGGVAWKNEELPSIEITRDSNKRIPVFSTGISYRINVFGVMVLELYCAYPFQRPEKGWHFGFQIMPGW